MKVSILIPTFNRVSYLKETIESALKQSYCDIEIIVSDNCSTDGTAELMAQYSDFKKIKSYRNESNLGMVGNWYKMLHEYTTGDFFLILSDDDLLLDCDYIAKAVALLLSDRQIKLVYANGIVRYENSGKDVQLTLPFKQVTDGREIILSRGKIQPVDFMLCNVLFNTELAQSLNSFENPNNLSCDSELFFKSAIVGKVAIVNSYASLYRIHDNNLVSHIVKNFDFFVNNWEYVSNAIPLMCEMKFYDLKQQEDFFFLLIKPTLSFAIFNAYIHHFERIEEVINKLKKDFGADIWDKYSSGRAIRIILRLPPRFGQLVVKTIFAFDSFKKLFKNKN